MKRKYGWLLAAAFMLGAGSATPVRAEEEIVHFPCPYSIPIPNSNWWPPTWSVAKRVQAGQINPWVPFTPTSYSLDWFTGVVGFAYYGPNQLFTTFESKRWIWSSAIVDAECIGWYPSSFWLITLDRHWGEAIQVLSDTVSTGGGDEPGGDENGGDEVCLEAYEYWYDEYGDYHEIVTDTWCYKPQEYAT